MSTLDLSGLVPLPTRHPSLTGCTVSLVTQKLRQAWYSAAVAVWMGVFQLLSSGHELGCPGWDVDITHASACPSLQTTEYLLSTPVYPAPAKAQ